MNQKGFTLIEVMVAMAVSSIVMVGIFLAIYQVVWGTAHANSQVAALADVNRAVLSIRNDLRVAQYTDLTDGDPSPQSSVRLSWTDYTGFTPEGTRNHSISYTLSGTDLLRTYDGTASVVGRYITSLGFTQTDRVITTVITATGPEFPHQSETLRFSVYTRTEEVP